MIIREEQQQALAESMQKDFEDRMVVHLRSGFAEEVKDRDELNLREFIQRGIDKAFFYGITIEADVSRFIEYMICYGERFDTNKNVEWVQPPLNSEKLNGTEKMDAIDRLNYIALYY
ncbi:MAG TPA: hypothetical protein VNB22_10505 [Pyrinomonadaceae bacterium]|jgi:hypothetical protein|nr:hypothetical protein [Pyrinomonadaceae bacterium]